jgi:tetratricopeptide (TPR) repeat protein
LIANGPTPRFKEAMTHHLGAIDLAAPLANAREFEARRLAKHILVDAHLAVARNISRGKYQRQRQVVPKWLSRSRALVEELVTRDQGDPALRLKVYQHVLASAADLENPDDPARVLEDLLAEGRRLIDVSNDAMNKTRLEWELGSALAEGVRLERLRGADRSALALADDALVLLQQSAAERQATPSQRYTVGRLYFQIGSLYAVHRGDHAEATEWYAKATPLLTQDIPVGVQAHPRIHGETFISMGVSYWKQGQRERAIELTEQGAEILQHAVVEGILPPETLAISYGNLASMHKQLGNNSDARAFAELANSLEGTADATIKR